MAWHLYLTPIIGDGTPTDKRRPEFVSDLGVSWRMLHFGRQPVGLVAADVSGAQDTTLIGSSGVTKIPDALDGTIGAGALVTVQNILENWNIPGTWLVAGTTYRELVRIVRGVFFIIQRYASVANNLNAILSGGVSLSTQFQDLPLGVRQNLQAAAVDLNIDTSGFTGASTLRQILKGVGDQYAATPFQLGGIEI
jgi:hypothetical protein